MSLSTPISPWIGFHLMLLALLAAELAFARRTSTEPLEARQHRTSIAATILWVVAALAFALWLAHTRSSGDATQFLAGYALEESLSIDNLFVFLLLFRLFGIPSTLQPRVLFWGVAGAIVMRGLFIAGGLHLLERFHWVDYLFAAVLLGAALRLLLPSKPESEASTPIWIRWLSRVHPVSLRTDCFFAVENGRRVVTMLLLALIAIELTDVVFALDSIPAVLSITRDAFLAYTSNIFAVMGLRSLFFLLANALKQLRFLHFGLAAVLAFAALKMLAAGFYEIAPLPSLAVILSILAFTVGLSLLRRDPVH
jgi:tellurite resistance protein TerC